MIQVYADDALVYDSRVQDAELLGLTAQVGLNKSGVAEIVMPKGHPAHDKFVGYRTLVSIYRDGRLRFRGRALYPSDDFLLRRTITCEGERGFFQDAVMRPYKYEATPAEIFSDVLALYNAQVEEFKQFALGTIDVLGVTDTVVLESDEAEAVAATLDKLVEMCGGYITFSTNAAGKRTVSWFTEVNTRSGQVIEYGGNLLDFARSDANTELATVIFPYGEKNTKTGARVSIEGDFIQDAEAVARRGYIAKVVIFEDAKTPEALLIKAQQYLEKSKNVITSLTLTAFDLSLLDKSVDSFYLGDSIHVLSKPHGVDEFFRLEEQDIDFLHPERDRIVLGRSVASLTGSDVAGDRSSSSALHRVERSVRADFDINQAAIVEETKLALSSMIQQTSEALMLEVSEQYATSGELESAVATRMTQLADSFTFLFTQLEAKVDTNDADARTQFTEIENYIRFEDGNIILGERGNEITLRIENDRISFLDDGAEVAYFSNKHLTVLDGSFLHSLQVGTFKFLPRGNGNLSLVKVGG